MEIVSIILILFSIQMETVSIILKLYPIQIETISIIWILYQIVSKLFPKDGNIWKHFMKDRIMCEF